MGHPSPEPRAGPFHTELHDAGPALRELIIKYSALNLLEKAGNRKRNLDILKHIHTLKNLMF